MFLLPESVDDYVGVDNPVRFIDAFVDVLDLAAAGFNHVEAKATGRPGYAPVDLLKLYIYGYLNRVRSSHRLKMDCHRNIEVNWLLRDLKPDFKTIADFRRDNRAAFRSVFRQFVLLCRRLALFGLELLAVDGTRIKAVNNKDRNFTRNSLRKFIRANICGGSTRAMSRKVERAARARKISPRRSRRRARRAAATGDAGGSRTNRREPDIIDRSRQPGDDRPYEDWRRLQYPDRGRREAQDDRLAGCDQPGRGHEPARAILDVETIDIVADRGYFKIEDIEACEKAGLTPHVPKPQRGSSVLKGLFRKDEFRYDPDQDVYTDPAGETLSPNHEGKLREFKKIDYSNPRPKADPGENRDPGQGISFQNA